MAWGLTIVLSAVLGVTGLAGLLGSGLRSAVASYGGPEDVANAASWNAWALLAGLLLTLAASVLGWWLGARGAQLAGFEQSSVVTASKEKVDLSERV